MPTTVLTTPVSVSAATDLPLLSSHPKGSVSWGAIFAGMTAALSLEVLFMMLGAGLGFAIYSPLTDANPVAELGKGAVMIQGISAVFSLWFGGWVAGRFAPAGVNRTGWLHGFCVWGASTVAGVLIVTAGAGWALGDLSKMVGGGLSLAGKPAAAATGGVADLAKDALKQSTDTVTSFTDESLARLPANAGRDVNVRAKREIGFAVARLFNPGQQANTQANRAALVKVLAEQTGVSEADADRQVTEWTASYDRLKSDLTAAKNEAEAKAREAADTAAKALAVFSLCAFVGSGLGALAASLGGKAGAHSALRHAVAVGEAL